jgi:hypothetical protein
MLTSGDPDQCRRAWKLLGWQTSERDPKPRDARIQLTNLDADEELEIIFVLSGVPTTTVVAVFNRDQTGTWFQVGEFTYWWRWNSEAAERLLELRELVDSGTKDILIRIPNGGSDGLMRELSIYRLRPDGQLRRVFRSTELEIHGDSCCSGWTTETRRQVLFPGRFEAGSARYLAVRQFSARYPQQQETNKWRSLGCYAYRWDANQFGFVLDRTPAATEYCRILSASPAWGNLPPQ